MLHISTLLRHYKNPLIQEEIVRCAHNKEVAARYGEEFGKRPDVLTYPNDVLELVKNGATSFHASEERWQNPLLLIPGMKKKDLDTLRIGWDLVLDVDCKIWQYSQLITHLLIQELKNHGVRSITCKFSGNKGFHIAVPFEAFPEMIHGKPVKELFPEGVKRIALYLTEKIKPALLLWIKEHGSIERINQELQGESQITQKIICSYCKKEQAFTEKFQFTCSHCSTQLFLEKDEHFKTCPRCTTLMDKVDISTQKCRFCSRQKFEEILDLSPLLQVDTVLISSRHLYRMPYSLHEKSGLVSLPCDPFSILAFDKASAKPERVQFRYPFLDTSRTTLGEASRLILQAFDFEPLENKKGEVPLSAQLSQEQKYALEPQQRLPAELFPPCILLGLQGMQDGKKRFLFALTHFLKSAGYGYDEIDQIVHTWNKKNPEPLREVIVQGQLRHQRMQQGNILPPNCSNRGYYIDLGLCKPDLHCRKIKNPFQYAKRKAFLLQLQEKKIEKLTDEQKEMRKKFREMKQKESIDVKKEGIDVKKEE